ncbi:cytochrome P450 [Maricaulis sp. D1M11]|uniref:cytochrome P450 n=1 Tax=Maricaulis sp. D1M11 TaxID=3076117 RepID=UPI0039B52904
MNIQAQARRIRATRPGVWPLELEPALPPGPPEFDTRYRRWRISRYDDIRSLLLSSDVRPVSATETIERMETALGQTFPNLRRFAEGNMVFQTGDRHREQKQVFLSMMPDLDRVWTQDRLRVELDTRLSAVDPGPVDFYDTLFEALMSAIAAEQLGLDFATTRQVVRRSFRAWESFLYVLRASQYADCEADLAFVFAHMQSPPRQGGRQFGQACARGLRDEELFFISAIWATTVSYLCAAMRLMAQSDDLQEVLAADRRLLERFLEEVLRVRPSTPVVIPRRPVRDVELAGVTLPAGAMLHLDIQSAGRDDAVYPEAALVRLDIARSGSLGFSAGAHTCLGQRLARRIALTVFERLLQCGRYQLRGHEDGNHRTGVALFSALMVDWQPK